MSGIYGIIHKNKQPIEKEWMNLMAENLKHRGTDGQGFWIENFVGIGHQMLFTTPESCFEKLPFSYKNWVITADVRLDNRNELCQSLEISKNQQATITDSYLILRAYEKWGEKCPEKLIGDFAFVVWDKLQKQLFCAVDHVGVRQFYYYDSPDYFVFCTEIKAIAQLPFVPKKLNENKLKDYLLAIWMGGRHEAETFFEGINRLKSAHWLLWQKGDSETHNYWKPQTKNLIHFADKRDYALALRELIQQAINDRIRSNYPIGISLSGGLDSSSIACLAARELAKSGKNLYSSSSVMPLNHVGIEEDERAYINATLAQEKNIVPFFVSAPGIGVFANLENALDKTYSPLNAFYYMDDAICQSLADEAKVRIVLTGYIGDATVSNSGKTVLAHLAKQGKFGTLFALVKQRKAIYSKAPWQTFVHDVLLKFLPESVGSTLKRIKGTPSEGALNLDGMAINKNFLTTTELKNLDKTYQKQFHQPINVYQNIWNINNQVFDVEMDTRSAHFQQEAVHPFADKRIIDFLFNIPVEHFLYNGWNRGLIRHAMDGVLPTNIQWRKNKTPYSPDYQRRIVQEMPFILNLMETEKNNQQINRYLDFNKIFNKLAQISPSKNWADFNPDNITSVYFGCQSIIFLKWLQNISKNV